MRKLLVLTCLLVLVMPVIAFAAAGSIEGTIQGFNCVMQGKTCPVGGGGPPCCNRKYFRALHVGKHLLFCT